MARSAQAGGVGAVEEPLHRRADGGGERQVGDPAVVHDVDVDDRRLPSAARRRRRRVGECRGERERVARRHGQHDRVGRPAALALGLRGARTLARARPSSTECPPAPRPRLASSASRAAVECSARAARRRTRRRTASAWSSRPVRNTFAASASDASSGGRFSVAVAMMPHSASIVASFWPWRAGTRRASARSRPRSAGSRRRSASAPRTARSRSGGLEQPVRASAAVRCAGAGTPGSAARRARRPSARSTGMSRRGLQGDPIVDAEPASSQRYASQQRRKTCWPLSTDSPAAGERERGAAEPGPPLDQDDRSRPASARRSAAVIPAIPPPTTTAGALSHGRPGPWRARGPRRAACRRPTATRDRA